MLDTAKDCRKEAALVPSAYPAATRHGNAGEFGPALYAAVDALGSIGAPALAFDQRRRVLVANTLIETVLDFARMRSHVLSFYDTRSDAAFRTAVAAFGD